MYLVVEYDNMTCNRKNQIFLKVIFSSYIADSIARARLPFQKLIQKKLENRLVHDKLSIITCAHSESVCVKKNTCSFMKFHLRKPSC